MKHFVLPIFILLVACNGKKSNATKANIITSGHYMICDTCQMTILVHHDECTTCGEITIDSGNIFLSNKIVKSLDTLAIQTDQLDTFPFSPNVISIRELFFAEEKYYTKLWTDTVHFKDWYKTFRLIGKVVEIKRRTLSNGMVEAYPSLIFKAESAVEVDSSYMRN